MDLETLTLVKLLLVAGLAWLSFRKIKRIEAHQQEIKIRHESGILQEMPIIERIKLKEESCLSTSAVSKSQVSYQEYNSIYDKFWVENNQHKQQDNRMQIEQPQKVNSVSGLKKRSQQNLPNQTETEISEFANLLKSHSSKSYLYRPKDINKKIKSKPHQFDRFLSPNQDKHPKCTLNRCKKTIVKLSKHNHLSTVPKNR